MNQGQMKREWIADTGPNRFRRGLYTYLWRATPHPFLTVFDTPNATQSCTRRLRSNTPLQALTLLNNQSGVEIAQALAQRILHDRPAPSTDDDRIRYAFSACLGREPSERELRTLSRFVAREHGEQSSGSNPSLVWSDLARILLNLDEFMTRE
jgi:hypothetical protein